jgi:hypothetical protein
LGALGVLLARKKVAREEIFGPVAAGAFLTMGQHGAVGVGMGAAPRGRAWIADTAQRGRRGRPAVTRPRQEWVGGACARGQHQTGEGRELTGGPATVLSGAWLKWFKPFSNLNGSKTLKKFKLWPTQKEHSRAPKIWNKIWFLRYQKDEQCSP